MKKNRQGFLWGTILLLFSNIFVKGLGFLYRVVLVRLLGAEGIGLVEMVTPLYTFLLVLGGWGIPLAISQAAARDRTLSDDVFKSGLVLLVVIGGLVTVAGWLLTPLLLTRLAPDARILPSLAVLLPAILLISVASAYRGYFQGVGQISALGASQSIEQTVRVAVGVVLALQLSSLVLEQAVTAAAWATLIGEGAGFLYLLARFQRQHQAGSGHFRRRLALRLLEFGTPVTLNRLALSFTMMLQAFLIPWALQLAGYDMRAATEIYGRFAGVAMTLLHLPGVFTAALAVSIIPAIAECGGDRQLLNRRVSLSLQATMVFSLPGMLVLFLFAEPLCSWLFHSPLAAPPLQLLCLGGLFGYLEVTVCGILQALGQVRQLLVNSLISAACLLVGVIWLGGQPELGINGACWAVNISSLLGFILNYLSLYRAAPLRLQYQNIFLKPTAALAVTAAAYWLLAPSFGQEKMAIAAMILLLLLIYFALLAALGGLSMGLRSRFLHR